MTVTLTQAEMDALRAIDSPTVANTVETSKVRHRLEGYTGPEIRCLFPDMDVMLGYAVTAKIKHRHRRPGHQRCGPRPRAGA